MRNTLCRSVIWHTDQGSQYGSEAVIDELIRKDFIGSMSRAGTPTDNGAAERMVGEFKHAVLRRMQYQTIGQLLREAERWINYQAPNAYARENGLGEAPLVTVSMC